ncbi:polysaccharide deacetylase [Colletotrichum navitas]|uniref:Polysaccharide deacetylase n=1 Tax=Colletotrichum navitas TaxID=681940 RepID=A0AAD8PJE4_9PEZI|nr:polysaccharide deacetylase [Colletotrichum navitas]KAK1564078.1 polysaccharide deacetylase [Colletotrichum navitas]
MLVRVHSLSLLMAVVASGELAASIPLESSSAFATRDMDRPRFGNVPYGIDITRCTVNGKVALTFDDGPGEYTEKVLDTLEKNGNIKATFFLVGVNGQNGINNPAYTPLLKRMLGAGHQLGSHSWSHKDFNTITHDQQVEELVKNEEIFAKTLGIVPTYFRPPYTHCDDKCISTLNDLSYHVADYNLDTKDWVDDGVNSKQTYSSAINSANPSSSSFIALAHDIHNFTVNGFVQYMIDVAKEKGFELTTMGECLGDPVSNWYRDPKSGEPSDDKEEPKPATTSKSVGPTTSSSAPEETKETKETKTTSSTTGSETAEASMTVKTATHEPESKTNGPTPTGATRTVDGGVNIGIPVTSAGTTAALRPTSTNTVVEVNAAGRIVFSAGGALAGALAWAMII